MVYSIVHMPFILFGDNRVRSGVYFPAPELDTPPAHDPVYSANVVAKGDTELSHE